MKKEITALAIIAERLTVMLTRFLCWLLVVGGTGYLVLTSTELVPRLVVPALLGEQAFDLGPFVAGAPLILGCLGLVLIPSTARVLRLEESHRSFQVSIADVTTAYHEAHLADRSGVFNLVHEYDAVRERITWLLAHADLGTLDGQIIELAAQMSTVSRTLADRYSDERVAHALSSLAARQREMAELKQLVENAQHAETQVRRFLNQVNLDEVEVRSQLERHTEAITTLLTEAGMEWRTDGTVVPLHRPRSTSSS